MYDKEQFKKKFFFQFIEWPKWIMAKTQAIQALW